MADHLPPQIEADGNGRLRVVGELTRHTATEALRRFDRLSAGLDEWVVDCSGCEPVDSAAVAWLIELRKRAQRLGRPLRFEALPPAVLGIARMSQVEDLLAPAD